MVTVPEFQTLNANGIALHTALAGVEESRPVILLHGFPEFWYGWREQIPALAGHDFWVIAPDQRGYNLSDKPQGVISYRLDILAHDILALADALGCRTFSVVGHDWGGAVAWWLAACCPDRLDRLAVLNAPHGAVFRRHMRRSLRQLRKSWYFLYFQIPGLVEATLRAHEARPLFAVMQRSSRRGVFSERDFRQYQRAW